MRLARLGAVGDEVPVVIVGDQAFDLRPLTRDIDGAFLATKLEEAKAAVAQADINKVRRSGECAHRHRA